MAMRIPRWFVLLALASSSLSAPAQARPAGAAIQLNNQGVAQMSQNLNARAAASFAAAFERDPALVQALINQGIALRSLQRIAESEAALRHALQLDPASAQAWYNLGLTQRADNRIQDALASFGRAAGLAPGNPDPVYFQGLCEQDLQQHNRAIALFSKALQIQPLHASAEFALARSMQSTGRTAEARQDFRRFQQMVKDKVSTPLGQAYGEQGPLSAVTPLPGAQAVEARMIPITLRAQALSAPPATATAPWTTTGGACMIDADADGRADLVLMQAGPQAIRVMRNLGGGRFEDWDAAAAGLRAGGRAVACAVGDYDNDGRNDLAVALDDRLLLFRNLGHGKFQDVTAAAGFLPRNHPSGITFVDYDHDGDLDLFLTGAPLQPGGQANVLWRNNGNGTFTEQTAATGLAGSAPTAAAILTDFNNDRAVDLATTGQSPSPLLYVNPREGSYPVQPLYAEPLPPTTGIAVLDFNKDGWMDIAVTHSGAPGLTLWRNTPAGDPLHRRFERVPLPLEGAARAWGLTPVDIDNDGWIDLAAIVQTPSGERLRVLRNRGDGRFEDVSHSLGLDRIPLQKARGLIAAPIFGDGAPDLIVTQVDAPPLLLRNLGAAANRSVRLDLTGYDDNKSAIGTSVEVFANGLWQKWEIPGASGFMTQGPPQQLLIGLGHAAGLGLLRLRWPTGVLQDEIDLPHRAVLALTETDRRGSSCPVLFVWNGHRYKFVTDVIGAGVVGHWFTPTRRNIPNPEEWVKIDGADVALVHGKLSLRFMEPMEEVNYVDQLRLLAIDHPADVEVNPDERFLDNPPFASGRLIASAHTRLPAAAWDGEGRDALARLSRRDHHFASGFKPLPYDGFANLHALTLDLGALRPGAPLRLLMTGYVNYFSATSLYAAWQAGLREIPPYIEAQEPDGSWKRIAGDAGFPAGLERTIVIDLTGKLPPGAHRIRLMTNLQIYWDQVLIDQSAHATARATEVPLDEAVLGFRGYPRQIEGSSPGDLDFDYNTVSLTGPFQRERGSYTRFGDVTPLLRAVDNRFAVFGSGEEIAADFDATRLPPLPPHWRRDYFFYANGYVKDMDWWDASPFTVDQMPFHGMSAYPYAAPEHAPDDAAALRYRLDWNDRFLSGDPVGTHRFVYRFLPVAPAAAGASRPATDSRPSESRP